MLCRWDARQAGPGRGKGGSSVTDGRRGNGDRGRCADTRRWLGPHMAARVGVLGWFNRSVLQSQPAKSTSSTSERLMKV